MNIFCILKKKCDIQSLIYVYRHISNFVYQRKRRKIIKRTYGQKNRRSYEIDDYNLSMKRYDVQVTINMWGTSGKYCVFFTKDLNTIKYYITKNLLDKDDIDEIFVSDTKH